MADRFESTAWSIITAARGDDSAVARAALETLCRSYWAPLYVYIREKGYSREEAEDLTQEFFARMLSNDFLGNVDRQLGRFRTFLLSSAENFLRDEWRKRSASKRGGGTPPIPLDSELGERSLRAMDGSRPDPHVAFDKRWAETLLDNANRSLELEYCASGRAEVFQTLKAHLGRGGTPRSYTEAAARLGATEASVRVAVHRLRKRFATLVRQEIARTVESPGEIQEELDYLIRVLGS